jgi:lysine 2,3-aminomutase
MKPRTSKQIVIREIEISSDDEPPPAAFSLESRAKTKQKNGYHNPGTNLTKSGFESPTGICISEKSKNFASRFFPRVSMEEWSDWKWQVRNSIRDLRRLKEFLFLSADEEILILENSVNLPLRITPYYLSLLDSYQPEQPLRKSVVPVISEFSRNSYELPDPLCEHEHLVAPNLIHRYPDRVLFLTTGFCSTYCRYCTRSHMVAKKDKSHFSLKELVPAFNYIRQHTEVRDVLLSGGDPLTISEEKLFAILDELKTIPHIEIIRIGTKVPVVLPQRITNSFVERLKKYHPLWMSIHFTHPDELTPEVKDACTRLADAGIPLGSQTVLLKGINDTVETMKSLMQGLLKIRVRPYYLYQCDPIPGSAHFRTTVEKGLEIIKGLRGHTSGYAVPHFVIDAPGGGGKIPLLPEYFMGRDAEGNILLKNYEENIYIYPDYSE